MPVVLDALSDGVKVGEVHDQMVIDFDLDMAKACSLDDEDCESCQ